MEVTTNNDFILAACQNDQEELLEELLKQGDFDINYTDGLGESALHYAARFGSLSCLELLVHVPNIELNLKNKKQGNTPLHLAVQYFEDQEVALSMVDILLDSGADPRIENLEKKTASDCIVNRNEDMKDLLDRCLAGYEMEDSDDDVVTF